MRSLRSSSSNVDFSHPIEQTIYELREIFKETKSNSLNVTNVDNNQISAQIQILKNFLETFKAVFNKSTSSRSKNIKFLNELSNESKVKFENELESNSQPISVNLLFGIVQLDDSSIRQLSLQCILYLSHFPTYAARFNELHVLTFVVRLVDLDLSVDDTILAVEYIRLVTQLHASCLNKSVVYCLQSSIEDSKYKLNNLLLETLLEIVCKRPKLACECNVFSELFNYLLNVCNDSEISIELIIQTLIIVADDRECRERMPLFDLLSNLLAPLLDVNYVPFTFGPNSTHHNTHQQNTIDTGMEQASAASEPKIESIIGASMTALCSLLSSYNGMMCFMVDGGRLIKNLLTPLSWYLQTNKREADRRMSLSEVLTGTTHSSHSEHGPAQSTKTRTNKLDLHVKQRELLIINRLLDMLYKIFNIEEIDTKFLIEKAFKCCGRSASSSVSTNYSAVDVADDDFINAECDQLFDGFENFSSQSNISNLIDEHKLNLYTTSPNMVISYRALLIKAFIEAGIFESLLDLYYGLPVSFLENSSLPVLQQIITTNNTSLLAQYELLSLRCLNLFSELYYLADNLLYKEYCIDDLISDESKNPFSTNDSIYNEMKKLALVGYLRVLNDLEREKEVITYLNQFNSKKEMTKDGVMLPTDCLSRLSFFSQQFLANSGYLSSKKYQIELEILNNSTIVKPRRANDEPANDEDYLTSIFSMVTNFLTDDSADSREKKEAKQRLLDVEKSLDDQLESTLVLQFELNLTHLITASFQTSKQWNWLEIIRTFELFLLTSSSMHPRFLPTQDSTLVQSNKKKFLISNPKMAKFIKGLFGFFSFTEKSQTMLSQSPGHLSSSPQFSSLLMPSQSSPRLTRQVSMRFSNSSSSAIVATNLRDQIACIGCYLIDFVLNDMGSGPGGPINKPDKKYCSMFEYHLIQFIQNIKIYLMNEFPTSSTHNMVNFRSSSNSLTRTGTFSHDSLLAYYVLFLGHLSSNKTGDYLLETYKIYETVLKIIELHKDLAFMKLVVSTFNFYESSQARFILEKSLCIVPSTSNRELIFNYNELKIYTLKLILNLFRANNLKFEAFFLDIIIKSIFAAFYSTEPNIPPSVQFSNEQVIELCLNLLEYFINLRPDLVERLLRSHNNLINKLDLIAASNFIHSDVVRLKLTFLAYRFKFSEFNLNQVDNLQIEAMLRKWHKSKFDTKYFQLVERYLFDACTVHANFINEIDDRNEDSCDSESESLYGQFCGETKFVIDENQESLTGSETSPVYVHDQDEFTASKRVQLYRRINDTNKNLTTFQANLARIYLPFHINTALIRHKQFLDEHFFLNNFIEGKIVKQLRTIRQAAASSNSSNKQLKSALWSVSSLCISENGFEFVSRLSHKYSIFKNLFEFICAFIKIAEEHESLSVRATCFFCSNLISKSCTGANLIGKLGWHSFQPNRFTPARAFHSILLSVSSEQQLFTIDSSIDTAVVLYNLNRSKSNIQLQQIVRYYYCDFSNTELKLLNEVNANDLANKPDHQFIKIFSANKIGGIYFENLAVPIRATLCGVKEDHQAYLNTLENEAQKPDSLPVDEKLLVEMLDSDCRQDGCFYCRLKHNGWLVELEKNELEKTDSSHTNRKLLVMEIIKNLIFMVNFDKSKVKKLSSLKTKHPNEFSFCFYTMFTSRYLSSYKIKFHMRKHFQELFTNILSLNKYAIKS